MTNVGTEPRLVRVWRGVSGAVAVGLVLLALALIGVQVYAAGHDLPGPGVDVVAGHVVAAVLAVVAQVFADRRTRWVAGVLGLAVLVLGAGVLWFFWWA
ncbi:hypothetical protein [Saccharothrix obliqua]|uniref:hypothetical protein n=1 Tax=Saccharothrix obliqua TaxID=2861747 RepID=UPI001C5FC0C1|nr:hypothetical protein [Saccharothrix obliqua]MBW4719313.1 hypothetical protein [Saccharothrix obliqua]